MAQFLDYHNLFLPITFIKIALAIVEIKFFANQFILGKGKFSVKSK